MYNKNDETELLFVTRKKEAGKEEKVVIQLFSGNRERKTNLMNTPDKKEVLVVSDEDEQEYLTDEIVLHNERIEQILQRHDSCKTKVDEYLEKLEDAECIKAFYMDTDELLEAMLLLVSELFSGKRIPIKSREQMLKKDPSKELEYDVELQLNVCKKIM